MEYLGRNGALTNMNPILPLLLRIIPAAIIGLTIPGKLYGALASREIFYRLTERAFENDNLEAFARLSTGLIELVAVVLLLIPKTKVIGAISLVVIMTGALLSHLFYLGFSGTAGQMAIMAAISLILLVSYLVLNRKPENEISGLTV